MTSIHDDRATLFPPHVPRVLGVLGVTAVAAVIWLEVSSRGLLEFYRPVSAEWPLPPRGFRTDPQPLLLGARSLLVLLAYAELVGIGMVAQVWRTHRTLLAKVFISALLLLPMLGPLLFVLLGVLPEATDGDPPPGGPDWV